jgi:hypothetical protein
MLVALDHALLQHGAVPAFAVSAAAVAMHVTLVAPPWPTGPAVGMVHRPHNVDRPTRY